MVGPIVDKQIQTYLTTVREGGGVIKTAITMAVGTGIILRQDSSLLAVNGGDLVLTKGWAHYLLERMELKEQVLFDIKSAVDIEDVPASLIFN